MPARSVSPVEASAGSAGAAPDGKGEATLPHIACCCAAAAAAVAAVAVPSASTGAADVEIEPSCDAHRILSWQLHNVNASQAMPWRHNMHSGWQQAQRRAHCTRIETCLIGPVCTRPRLLGPEEALQSSFAWPLGHGGEEAPSDQALQVLRRRCAGCCAAPQHAPPFPLRLFTWETVNASHEWNGMNTFNDYYMIPLWPPGQCGGPK